MSLFTGRAILWLKKVDFFFFKLLLSPGATLIVPPYSGETRYMINDQYIQKNSMRECDLLEYKVWNKGDWLTGQQSLVRTGWESLARTISSIHGSCFFVQIEAPAAIVSLPWYMDRSFPSCLDTLMLGFVEMSSSPFKGWCAASRAGGDQEYRPWICPLQPPTGAGVPRSFGR